MLLEAEAPWAQGQASVCRYNQQTLKRTWVTPRAPRYLEITRGAERLHDYSKDQSFIMFYPVIIGIQAPKGDIAKAQSWLLTKLISTIWHTLHSVSRAVGWASLGGKRTDQSGWKWPHARQLGSPLQHLEALRRAWMEGGKHSCPEQKAQKPTFLAKRDPTVPKQ